MMQRREMLKSVVTGATTLGALAGTGGVTTAATEEPVGIPLEQNGVKAWTESSLKRVYPTSAPGSAGVRELTAARNSQISCQICFRHAKDCSIRVRAKVEVPNGWSVQIRRVGFVPVQQLETDVPLDEIEGIGHVPGLVPDPLYPDETAHVGPEANGVFWVTIKVPRDATVGRQPLTTTLTVEDEFRFPGWTGATPRSITLPVEVDVKPLVLERRKDFPVTHWISIDSIWEYYKIEPFSERFWELADAYVANLVAHNLNVLYSPVFNARHEVLVRPAQLLKVRRQGADKYELDFSDVRRWIRLAKKHGVEQLEWTHFFTPAPTSGRHPQRIYERWEAFGPLLWPIDTLAASDEYRNFLEQFIPQFKQILQEESVLDRSLFHCADEPDGDVQLADYRKARQMLRDLAPWMKVIDAMSDPQISHSARIKKRGEGQYARILAPNADSFKGGRSGAASSSDCAGASYICATPLATLVAWRPSQNAAAW